MIFELIGKGKIKLIDTPGVLQFNEKNIEMEITIGSMNPQHVKEPDYYAMILIEKYTTLFEKFYNEKYEKDASDFIEKVAYKRNLLKKGGEADLQRFGRQLLQDWQKGKIHEEFLVK